MKPRVARNELLWGADRGGKKPRRGFGNPHAHTQHSSQGPRVGVHLPRGGVAQEQSAILHRETGARGARRL